MDWSAAAFLIISAIMIAGMLITLAVLAWKGIGKNTERDGAHRDNL